MITGIVLYYLWIVLDIAMSYLLLRCVYDDDDERLKFPVWAYLVACIVTFLPLLNIAAFVGGCFIFVALYDDDYHIKHFLFKKI